MAQLIMMRHGESVWNHLNLFTGWVDIPLSPRGIQEAIDGGKLIQHLPIDIIFTSSLVRAQMSAFLAMSVHLSNKVPVLSHLGEGQLDEWGKIYGEDAEQHMIPVIPAWQLNERMYGQLQGQNKAEASRLFGAEQVQIWRRSYDVAPPGGESLAMTAKRTIPYFQEEILPHLGRGKNVFISAHGNSLRAIIMHLDQLTPEQVVHLEIATGVPLFYEYAEEKFSK